MKTPHILAVIAGAALVFNAHAALEKEFPKHWGEPPQVQTRDLRKLPGDYGMGSSTLAKWIETKMKADKIGAEDGNDAKATLLFDGKTLKGFSIKSGTATYVVEDGVIVGTTAKGSPNTFLCTDKEYGDFELEFEVMVDARLNSGVQIRSKLKGDKFGGRVYGPQVEIEDSGKNGAEAGYIYGEQIGGWLTPKADLKPHKKFKSDEWNHYRIVAKGPNIKVWINGDMVSDLTNEKVYADHTKGLIGFQVHGVGNGGPFQVKWKNIMIKEL